MAVAAPTPAETFDPFEMTVPEPQTSANFEPCPPGNHVATIVGVFDVGTHSEEYEGKHKDQKKMVICFELQKTKADGKHFIVSKSYTMSMGDKSNWFKFVTGITAQRFKSGDKFTARSMVGVPCMIMMTNEKKTDGEKERIFEKVESIAQYPEGLPIPTTYRPPVIWSPHYGTPLPDTSWVPKIYGDSVKDLVEQSKEFQAGKVAESSDPKAEDKPPF
jgi:hypothetical protein